MDDDTILKLSGLDYSFAFREEEPTVIRHTTGPMMTPIGQTLLPGKRYVAIRIDAPKITGLAVSTGLLEDMIQGGEIEVIIRRRPARTLGETTHE